MRILAIFISALAIAVVAVGCGDDSSSDSASLTKAEFTKKANAACRKINLETSGELLAFINKNDKKPLTEEQKLELVDTTLLPSLQKQVDALSELDPEPEAQQQVLDELVEALEEEIEKGEADPEYVATEVSPFAKSEKVAQDNELEFCGRSQ